jgi:hypothetical protein
MSTGTVAVRSNAAGPPIGIGAHCNTQGSVVCLMAVRFGRSVWPAGLALHGVSAHH